MIRTAPASPRVVSARASEAARRYLGRIGDCVRDEGACTSQVRHRGVAVASAWRGRLVALVVDRDTSARWASSGAANHLHAGATHGYCGHPTQPRLARSHPSKSACSRKLRPTATTLSSPTTTVETGCIPAWRTSSPTRRLAATSAASSCFMTGAATVRKPWRDHRPRPPPTANRLVYAALSTAVSHLASAGGTADRCVRPLRAAVHGRGTHACRLGRVQRVAGHHRRLWAAA